MYKTVYYHLHIFHAMIWITPIHSCFHSSLLSSIGCTLFFSPSHPHPQPFSSFECEWKQWLIEYLIRLSENICKFFISLRFVEILLAFFSLHILFLTHAGDEPISFPHFTDAVEYSTNIWSFYFYFILSYSHSYIYLSDIYAIHFFIVLPSLVHSIKNETNSNSHFK